MTETSGGGTGVVTHTPCSDCGAPNLGTRYCESCGALAAQAPLPVPTPVVAAAAVPTPALATLVDPAVPFRILALVSFALSLALPNVVEWAAANAYDHDPAPYVWTVTLTHGLVGLFLLMAGATGRAGAGGKTTAILLSLLGSLSAILQVWVGVYGDVIVVQGFFATPPVLYFLAWAAGKPFRPRGYLVLFAVALAVVVRALVVFMPGFWADYGRGLLVEALLTLTLTGVIVTMAALLGKPAVLAWSAAGAPPPQAFTVGDPPTTRVPSVPARTALILALGATAASLLTWIPVLGFVMAFLALGGWVAAIVVAHVALFRIRRTGEGGRGQAIAGLVIGYVFIGLGVVLTVIQLLAIQSLLGGLSSYSSTYPDSDYGETAEQGVEGSGSPDLVPSQPAAFAHAVPEDCDELFSADVASAANAAGLVLNPSWADDSTAGLEIAEPELRAMAASIPSLSCFWVPPEGATSTGIRTTVGLVSEDEAAWLDQRLRAEGYRAFDELGGTRYVWESTTGGGHYGESHIVLDGVWFATHWSNYGPQGYTADVVGNYFARY